MSKGNKTPHVTHQHDHALLIIDMLNTLEFPEADQLLPGALRAADHIAKLKKEMKSLGIPVLYVNDNFGQWQSDRQSVYAACSRRGSKGCVLATRLKPQRDDYFVLKPMHSAFYSTTLDVLLKELGTKKLILTGIAGNICVLFTANDAHMRNFDVIVPEDCIASNTLEDNDFALRQMRQVLQVDTRPSSDIADDLKRKRERKTKRAPARVSR